MKKVLFFLFILISFFIINNLVRSIANLWQKQDLVVRAQEDLENHKRENQIIKQKLQQAESPDFVEKQAREKLLLVKQGESEVILPKELRDGKKEVKTEDVKPNWQKWVDLFF